MGKQKSVGSRRGVPGTSVVTGGESRPGDMTERQKRAILPGRTVHQIEKNPDLERRLCEACMKLVALRKDGTMRGHQARRGISCVGATPTMGSNR